MNPLLLRRSLPVLLPLLAALAAAQECDACDEPVFRYALTSWETDAYTLRVYLASPSPSPAAKEALDFLEKRSFRKGGKANFTLQVLTAPPPVRPGAPPPKAPWMVLSYPDAEDRTAWEGPLTMKNARALTDSPARRRLAELLLDGESVPWVLLESGRKKEDEEAAAFLSRELAALPGRLERETRESAVPGGSPRDLKVVFPLIRIRRDDPAERIFVSLLLGAKPGLARALRSGPLVFPFFGRGRILDALTKSGITPDSLLRAGRFLAGPCACEVKGMAPGLDMLFSADWEKADLQPLLTEIDLPPLTGLPAGEDAPSSPPGEKAPAAAPAAQGPAAGAGGDAPAQPSPAKPIRPTGFGRTVLITLAVLAALLGGLAVFFLRSGKEGSA